ncbi:MobF family relaxase [Amycolatopsis sp. NPDC059657]|uniref:MobF family relaxase n=1 Tax=Amycolatopsis sp. NPDC059657 TaxID=3346899 RepID=UPI003671EEBB
MLRITPISAGAGGVEYLLRATGCAEHDHAAHTREAKDAEKSPDGAEYFLRASGHGEAVGVWHGKGLGMLGISDGDKVDPDVMRAVYGRLEHPDTEEPLGRRPRNYSVLTESKIAAALANEPTATEERQAEIRREMERAERKARAFYDVTVSPSKSASVYRAALEAAGQFDLADAMDEAHRIANAEMLAFAERNIVYTRVGSHTTIKATGKTVGEYAEIKGLIVTSWEHSTSREGDPHAHIHNAVLNRVETKDGKIYALDAQAFKSIKGQMAMVYERRYEEEVTKATGARWAWRPDGKAREILGVDRELCGKSSGRYAQVQANLDKLLADYREKHDREPGRIAMARMRRQAWADGRRSKSPLSPAAQRERYVRKHGVETLTDVVTSVQEAAARVATEGHPDAQRGFATEDELVKAAVENTQSLHAAWDETALALELNKLVGEVSWGDETDAEISRLIDRALDPEGPAGVLPLVGNVRAHVPDALRHTPGGDSIYAPKRGIMYATREHMSAEKQLLGEAALKGGPVLTAERAAELELQLAETTLHPDQRNAVMGIMTSGSAADVMIGPAGTGKSFTVGKLDELWRSEFGAPVMGVATSQRATNVLREEGLDALNTSMFLQEYGPGPDGQAPKQTLPRGVALIVDEAGMADTKQLAKIAELVRNADGKLLYTGDDAQLAAVGPGGILRLLAADHEPFVLGEVQRFKVDPLIHTEYADVPVHQLPLSPWEGEASLRMRDGDASVLAQYEQAGRLRAGDIAEMGEAAVRGYMADIMAGRSSVLVVSNNDQAADLGGQIRDELVALGKVDAKILGTLRDENFIGVGDQVQARLNWKQVQSTDGEMLVNREILTVLGKNERGDLLCQRSDSDAVVTVPESYFKRHMTLGYASTIHAVQGRTVDTAHALVERSWIRNGLYVAMTRGRYSNIAYGVTEVEPDAHNLERYSVQASDLLREILSSDGSTVSAIEYWRTQLESADSLEEMAPLWELVTRDTMADRHHDVLLSALGPDHVDWMTKEDGHERLLKVLQHVELSGYDVPSVVNAVLGDEDRPPLSNAEDMSAALAFRVRKAIDDRGPRPVPKSWRDRTAATPGTRGEFVRELGQLMDERVEMMARSAVLAPPEWALVALGPMPPEDDERARLGWTQRVAAIGAYREMTGMDPDQMGIGQAPSREHEPVRHVAWTRAWEALGRPAETADHHTATVEELRERIVRWEAEKIWAPVYVSDQLQKATTLAEEYRREAMLAWKAVEAERQMLGDAEPTPDLAKLVADAELADRQFERFAEATRRYERLQTARDAWVARTSDLADSAASAVDELIRREEELDAATPAAEQQPIFDIEDDRVVLPDYVAQDALELDDGYVLPPEPDAEYDEPDFDEPDYEDTSEQPVEDDRTVDIRDEVEIFDGELMPVETAEAADVAALPDYVEIVSEARNTEINDDVADDVEVLDGELLDLEPAVQAEHDRAAAEAEDREIVDADVIEEHEDTAAEVTDETDIPLPPEPEVDLTDEVEENVAKDETAEAEKDPAKGDYGTDYRLDMPEHDAQYPAPAEPDDPNQLALFEPEPTAEDRISAGQVRPDLDMTMAQAETRAELKEQMAGTRQLAADYAAARDADTDAERRRQERMRDDRQAAAPADRTHEHQASGDREAVAR